MTSAEHDREAVGEGLPKCPTEIRGLDEITGGGLPRGRPTLVCGGPGSGKTLLAMEFLVRGAVQHGEPGVFMAFEETATELAANVRSLGFDVDDLVRNNLLHIDHVKVDRSEIVETGEYDLEGLFVRLGRNLDRLGARRVALDTLETLFSGLSNQGIIRAELQRLFHWLKEKGATAIVTAERGDGLLTRQGMEEYISDCVIALDHRVTDQVSTRRMRIVKYRGSAHGTNEYPFLISDTGISVLPITSLGLRAEPSDERITTGMPRLDAMLGGQGYFRGSSVLISGSAGTGKSSMAALFADATCRRGERCLYLATEESQGQIVRNLRSIGLDLKPWILQGLLRFHCERPTATGLEVHLVTLHALVRDFRPRVVIVDPLSNFVRAGTQAEAGSMSLRLIDFLKGQGITTLLTNLVRGGESAEFTELNVSSQIDTWIMLRDVELGGERNRALYIIKSRGMAHSNQLREFLLTEHGIDLLDAYIGAEGVLTGSMRLSQVARERAARVVRRDERERKKHALDRKRRAFESRMEAMRLDLEAEEEELLADIAAGEVAEDALCDDRARMARSRRADPESESADGPVPSVIGADR